MKLNDIGRIVEVEWLKTPTIRRNVGLDAYAIIPNHIHGIIILNDENSRGISGGVLQYAPTVFRSPSQTLGAIVRGFNAASTRRANIFRSTPSYPLWQRNHYDHIIRNDTDLTRIRMYITNNPVDWSINEESPDAEGWRK